MYTIPISRAVLLGHIVATALAAAVSLPAHAQTSWLPRPTSAPRPNYRGPSTNADFERFKAESARWLEQQKQKHRAEFDRNTRQMLQDQQRRYEEATRPIPFNAAAAPSPADSWRAFVNVARSASSMDQILPFLPQREAQQLKERQAQYDPREAVASQQRWRQKDPKMSERSITFLTNSAYANALDHYRGIAQKFIDVLSAKVEGNKATLTISTRSQATSNGEKYPYGKATVEMIGEGNSWRLDAYNDSGWHYQEVPTKP
jgi:hypothetical protein